jgi:hypothetical protein
VAGQQDWREKVLARLAANLGFCLSGDAAARLASAEFDSAEQFADAVFLAEAMDPATADPETYRQVRELIAEGSPTWRTLARDAGDRARAMKRTRR